MNESVSTMQTMRIALKSRGWLVKKRLFLPVILLSFLWWPFSRETTQQVLADAFFQVGAFVYASLALYYLCTLRVPAETISRFIARHPFYEVFIAAFLGALPGCGGAIIVVTQYTRGVASFGSVVAVLTSTMGDAAFLLLARQPADGLTVMAAGMVVGSLTGIIVNRFHNYRPELIEDEFSSPQDDSHTCASMRVSKALTGLATRFWLVISIPVLLIAMALALQISPADYLPVSEQQLTLSGAVLAIVSVTLWATGSVGTGYYSLTSEDPGSQPPDWKRKAALDTQFVLVWVIMAFMLFEISMLVFGVDLVDVFQSMGVSAVALAILIGFLPGCGPQILVTTLYLNGALPFSAQLGNAISNDGDALFPAIALSPRAALLATLYSGIPAFLVGFGYYFLFEL
ncbi:putative manganese transporter [Alteromonas sp. 1_MG-2023]|uniref:putative manganese transporter n=1 Tax=Alteromonas sp. 1_MG-2023 TaxID=3062669 RepID=UPI0026E332F8|nr:putative manganese transporter [Alteromonas sp. 1_MG-2023]